MAPFPGADIAEECHSLSLWDVPQRMDSKYEIERWPDVFQPLASGLPVRLSNR